MNSVRERKKTPKAKTNGHEAESNGNGYAYTDYLDPKLLLTVLLAVKSGDFSSRMPTDQIGMSGKICDVFNEIIETNEMLASELGRISEVVGKEGKITQRATLNKAPGAWGSCINSVNALITDLAQPTTEVARVIGAVAEGDLSQTFALKIDERPLKGDFLRTGKTVNTMVERLSAFASEVTRVAREVGTEGKLGGQAEVKGVSGTWKDLTENVNLMTSNLTAQVRNIADVTTAVANGDLSRKIAVEVRGEVLERKNTVNTMVDQLNSFASEVTRVAREVGIEGELGGQANVPGASGTWRDLTDNVNQLAANLTNQVRAMSDVATAVTKGDLTRTITVDASGEVAFLKDNVNEMIRNLRETTQKNTEQDWLKTNLAKFTRLLQGQRDLITVARMVLSEMAPLVGMHHGVFYIADCNGDELIFKLLASYAYRERKSVSNHFKLGEGIVGQCALEKKCILLTDVPSDYIRISSGLGEAVPFNIIALPVIFEGQVKAVIELASFYAFNDIHLGFLDQLTESIGIVLNTIEATMRTEELLMQSQTLTQELQIGQLELQETNRRLELQAQSLQRSEELLKKQQEELQQTNSELEDKARSLSEQKSEVEGKNQEIEIARTALEDKAKQLALSSKYKSEFLANMSHELRTPLNSMLILSKMLSENPNANLSEKQIDFAETIHSSGADLLALINEILDLSKIESGTMGVEIGDVYLEDLRNDVERTFGQIAHDKDLEFKIEIDEHMPQAIQTDEKRLRQVLKNLLSNAFKFTHQGTIMLRMNVARGGWNTSNNVLSQASNVIAFSVSDTGIGIFEEKQQIIFEAFQQADGTTSRKYGGTGLGLSISREIARLLGGEITLTSTPGEGSKFTLYLPEIFESSFIFEPNELAIAPALTTSSNSACAQSSSLMALAKENETDGAATSTNRVSTFIADDRVNLESGDRVVLIVEDDYNFAKILIDIAHEQNFKVLVAHHGEDAIAIARKFKPNAITLDLTLPGMHGYAVLDRLKHDPTTRHIPVQIVSVIDDLKRILKLGGLAHLTKPVKRETLVAAMTNLKDFVERKKKRLLLVEDDEILSRSINELISGDDVEIKAVTTGTDAFSALEEMSYDCAIVDLMLPDIEWSELIEKIKQRHEFPEIPIIVHTGKNLTAREAARIKKLAEKIILKDADSLERLVDETALFLHREVTQLSESQKKALQRIKFADPRLAGKKVLIVDDDIRNIFALTSALERQQMQVIYAENGRNAIEMLQKISHIDGILMDIMMPEMDGYEAMQEIRNIPAFKKLPIIAVTAKAMKDDRQKCLEAGASDYITKPVDTEQLFSLLRIWLDQ